MSVLIIRELTISEVCPCHDMSAHYSWLQDTRYGVWNKLPALFGPAFEFINMLVTGDQA